LYVDTSNVVQVRAKHVNLYTPAPTYSPTADNFAWSKLLDKEAASDGFLHFMPKCVTAGCATGNALFLPDKSLFPYF
jgi:hypothetical protein